MLTSILLKRRFFSLFLCSVVFLASFPAQAGNAYLRPWPASRSVPSLKLSDMGEKTWDISALHGKVIVLNFWAIWCEPCVEEIQFLNELSKANRDANLLVLGVNFKDSPAVILKFSAAHKFDYPVLLDKSGDSFKQWADGVLPATVLIDRKGKPRWKVVGALDADNREFRQTLEQLLKE